jgi:hypothetical protein
MYKVTMYKVQRKKVQCTKSKSSLIPSPLWEGRGGSQLVVGLQRKTPYKAKNQNILHFFAKIFGL